MAAAQLKVAGPHLRATAVCHEQGHNLPPDREVPVVMAAMVEVLTEVAPITTQAMVLEWVDLDHHLEGLVTVGTNSTEAVRMGLQGNHK